MRAVLIAAVAAALVLLVAACGDTSAAKYPINVYVAGKHFASVAPGHTGESLPTKFDVRLGIAQVQVRVDHAVAVDLIKRGLDAGKGRVDLPYTRVWSYVKTSSQKQLYPHGSELAALSMLLADVGIDAPQVHLVTKIKRDGPTDPQPITGSSLFRWGDPDRGFVGSPTRAGATGGFGVYEGPIRKLAAKYGIRLVEFRDKTLGALRDTLLDGHPLVAWIDWTGAGKRSSWLTPSGKKITVNPGQRAVVLIGASPGRVIFNDPGSGKELRWTNAQFAKRWALAGHHALELP